MRKQLMAIVTCSFVFIMARSSIGYGQNVVPVEYFNDKTTELAHFPAGFDRCAAALSAGGMNYVDSNVTGVDQDGRPSIIHEYTETQRSTFTTFRGTVLGVYVEGVKIFEVDTKNKNADSPYANYYLTFEPRSKKWAFIWGDRRILNNRNVRGLSSVEFTGVKTV